MIHPPSIFEWITTETNHFDTEEIQVGDNMYWSFRKHTQLIFHLKNGTFYQGDNNWLRAFRNIMEPILELAYWTEDLEVKDVAFYIDQDEGEALSFLVKKYHDEIYVKEHDLDTLFDEITESDLDYGGVLVQKGTERPEVVPLQSVAFCDQTDILGGALAFKFYFSPSKLKQMSVYGWGEENNGATISLEELCTLATADKKPLGQTSKENKIPSKTIEVYIVRGNMPEHYLEDNNDMEYYCNQLQIIAYYTKEDSTKVGVTLYRKKAQEDDLMFFTSKPVYQRALGRGMGERLLHPQIWTNFIEIHKMKMLQAGAKSPLYTDDPTYKQKNKIEEMENNEITTIEDNKRIYRVPTLATENIQLYSNEINALYEHAQTLGQANDPIMGKESPSGTTFRGQERSVAQGRGSHDKRRGQRAKFIEKIYRKTIIPDIVKEILKGQKFLATLSSDELTWVAEKMSTNLANKRVKDLVLKEGRVVFEEERVVITQLYKEGILKKGNKQLLEILKGEFEGIELKMGINIAGKQKDLVGLSDKILSIFQFALANPIPPNLVKPFNDILEYGGISPVDFAAVTTQSLPSPLQPTQPRPELAPATPANE